MNSWELREGNMGEFWQGEWEDGATGWKFDERCKPFARNVRDTLAAFHIVPARKSGTDDAAADDDDHIVRSVIGGWRVFVPLCGDSAVMRFFHDCGCAVVGVDIVPQAINSLVGNVLRGCSVVKVEGEEEYAVDGRSRLFCGDAFTVMEALLAEGKGEGFDFVYDRSAMMAIPPPLLPRYCELLKSLMNGRGVAFVECALRPSRAEELESSPPFVVTTTMLRENLFPAPKFGVEVTKAADMALLAEIEKDATAGPMWVFFHCAVIRIGE